MTILTIITILFTLARYGVDCALVRGWEPERGAKGHFVAGIVDVLLGLCWVSAIVNRWTW